ncbi:g9527 [Coccomyxa elongata]
MLPLPASRPAVAIVKATKSDVGRTVVGTIAAFLLVLLASPLYDVYSLHSQKEKSDSAETLLSDTRRETEASANLSLTLTSMCLALLIIIRAWGLAVAEVDELRSKYGVAGTTDVQPTDKVE